MDLKTFIAGMPKLENHVHLDGSTYPASALVLAERNHVTLPFQTLEEAERLYQYESLDDFLRIINAVCSVIQTEEDFTYLTVEMAKEAKAQNILYRDVMLSCYYHEKRGIPFETMIRGFIAGRKIALEQYGVLFSAIPEIDRTMPPEESLAFIERLIPFREEAGIVAVGLDSAEDGYPAHWHEKAFARASELGFHVTAHAGEAYGPVSVEDTLDSLHAKRIDHGVRAIEDPELVARLAREKILLTVCPLSNVSLKVYPDMAHHSFKQLYDAGVPVSVNSDDPPFFGGNPNDNYLAVAEAYHLTAEQLLEIAKNAFVYSYAPKDLVDRGVRDLEAYFRENAPLLEL
jgi:adenosine deaminase